MLYDRILNKPDFAMRDFNKSFYLSNGGCDFKFLKKFLRSYKNDYYFTEYVFIVDALKGIIKERYSTDVFKELGEAKEYFFYEYKYINSSYKIKDKIDLFLIKYLNRYIDFCKKYHYKDLLEYQKKLNIEAFKRNKFSKKELKENLKKWIEAINNEILFGGRKNILFYFFDFDSGHRTLFLIPLEDKKEFLENELQLLQSKFKDNIEPEAIDLSDTSTTEKIIYLQKLGVIDFLKNKQPFLSSTNSLATVLSAVTGAKAGTIQSMINPILSKKVDDSNNPLNSKKAVERVEKQLINIGFNLNETI